MSDPGTTMVMHKKVGRNPPFDPLLYNLCFEIYFRIGKTNNFCAEAVKSIFANYFVVSCGV